MPTLFYDDESMVEVRTALETRVLLWPGVVAQLLLGCPSYLVGGHPFAVLVDGSILLPQVPAWALAKAPHTTVRPLEKNGLPLKGWLRVRARNPQEIMEALPLVRAGYEIVRGEEGVPAAR